MRGKVDDDDGLVHVLYIFIQETAHGFRWQVRGHGLTDPIETGRQVFASDGEARAAGRGALDRACAQFRRYGGMATDRA